MRYERGIARLYIVAAAIWVVWGLYRPIPQHRRLAANFLGDANTRLEDCLRMKSQAEMEGWGTPDPDDRCGKLYSKETDIGYAMLNRGVLEIWRGNILSVATGCLVPPAGGAILLVSLFWAFRGFRRKGAD